MFDFRFSFMYNHNSIIVPLGTILYKLLTFKIWKFNRLEDEVKMKIRKEKKSDYFEVENLTREAFWNIYRPGCFEHLVVHKIRTDKDFVKKLDFVIEEDGKINYVDNIKEVNLNEPVEQMPKEVNLSEI